jgi:hypothetical protein
MKALRDLRKFILIKCAEGNQAEVRSYVRDNLDTIAYSFNVPAEAIMGALESQQDDGELAARLLETILRAEEVLRKGQRQRRAKAAQESATVLASSVQWQGEKACIDMPSLLASALTRRQDMLVFTGDDLTVSIPMAPLLDLSKIARVRADLAGFVDKHGLHLRWKTGALNLRSQVNDKALRIVVHLPARAPAVAA